MSIVEARIRLLATSLKRFFNTIAVLPVRVLTAFRIVVPYENALHRLLEFKTGNNALDFGTTGFKLIKKIPVGEIWIPEWMNVYMSTGSTARFDKFVVQRKGGTAGFSMGPVITATANINWYRGLQYPVNMWLYPGDQLSVNVSTGNAGDMGICAMFFRRIRVGDDY